MKHTLTALILLCNSLLIYPQVILTIEGTVINDTEPGFSYGVNIYRAQPTLLTYRNNSITSVNSSGYMLLAGDEVPGIYNNNLDGGVITGNKFLWQGVEANSTTHALFTGYNIDITLKYNYLINTPNGIQRKSNGMTDTTGVIAYNIIKNSLVGIVVKGMNGVRIYNNTFYCERTPEQTERGLIDIHTNTDGGLNATSKGVKIFNNIFFTVNNTLMIKVYETTCLEGFESDYNLFWCESGEPLFQVGGSTRTFSQWQAMGYDRHSVVINPNFNNLTDFVPEDRLDFGKDLGDEFIEGLATNAIWSNISPRTAIQNDTWQVGARIYEEEVNIEEPLDSVTLIYPNPSNGLIYILNNDSEKIFSNMTIFNSKGIPIMQQAINNELNTVFLSDEITSGLYTVVLEGGNLKSYIQKLIIIR